MSTRCKALREQSLRDGMDSEAAQRWRNHSRTCEKCRSELYILDALHRQARSSRRHMTRPELCAILAEVRRRNRPRPVRERILRWTWRVACVWGVIAFAAVLHQVYLGEAAGGGGLVGAADSAEACEQGADVVARESDGPTPASCSGAAVPRQPAVRRESLDFRVRQLRRDVERRRRSLLDLIDRDFGGVPNQHVRISGTYVCPDLPA